jgi:hypothetical protein
MNHLHIVGSSHDDNSFLSLSNLESSISKLSKLHVATKGGRGSGKTQRLVDSIAKQSQQLLLEAAAIKIQRTWRGYLSLTFVRRVYRRRQRLSRRLQAELQQVSWIGNRLLEEISIYMSTIIAIDLHRHVQQIVLHQQYSTQGIEDTIDSFIEECVSEGVRQAIGAAVQEMVAEFIYLKIRRQSEDRRQAEKYMLALEQEMMTREDASSTKIEEFVAMIEEEQQYVLDHPEELLVDELVDEPCAEHYRSIVIEAIRELMDEYLLRNRVENIKEAILTEFVATKLMSFLPNMVKEHQLVLVADMLANEVQDHIINDLASGMLRDLHAEVAAAKRRKEMQLIHGKEDIVYLCFQHLIMTHIHRRWSTATFTTEIDCWTTRAS